MFHSARLKLTAWYLLIIMSISFAFSAVLYTFLSHEVERFARAQRSRIERQRTSIETLRETENTAFIRDPDLVAETKHRVLFTLFSINGFIFIIAGGLGYILAGRTLRPIQKMVDEQHRFIQDASHELRTPLTSLKSSLEVSLRDKHATTQELKKVIEEGIEDTNRLQSLTDALLQLAQYERPENQIMMTQIDVNDIIQHAKATVLSIAKKKQISITYVKNSYTLKGDRGSVIEIVEILLENAIKYSPKNSTITIKVEHTDRTIQIKISDSGIGIEARDLPFIFDRFYRADAARTNNETSGYGLGLSIAKHLVTKHNGTISASSILGHGTTFLVKLPA